LARVSRWSGGEEAWGASTTTRGRAAQRSADDLGLGCVVDAITLENIRESTAASVGILPYHRTPASNSSPFRICVVVVSAIVSSLSEPPPLSAPLTPTASSASPTASPSPSRSLPVFRLSARRGSWSLVAWRSFALGRSAWVWAGTVSATSLHSSVLLSRHGHSFT
jgi:hypothetical protein